ncbi:hypothetical protein [Methanoculleus chikugoensis]|uniref:DUF4263 domain-containing protein n=1 Tax=Methanoculleus chikugoensis TaxID=118126 RepID=A0ABM7H5H8_9EURY|nr:hypothetical protein [Methanoculleus chikugoensis]BBL68066.1 hypothetical protein MchiMG62_12470 [Methanoculleus chikugoensis]
MENDGDRIPTTPVEILPDAYSADFFDFTEEKWEEYEEYHASKLAIKIEDLQSAMKEIGVDDITIDKRITELKADLEKIGASTDAKGNFGEAQSAYYLEKKKGYVILPIGWAEEPFKGHGLIDLYGLDGTRQFITYIECKAAVTSSSYSGLINDLVENQLRLKRIMPQTRIGDTSIAAISKALQSRLISDPDFSIRKEELESISDNPIMRIGVILHSKKRKNDYSGSLKHLYRDEMEWRSTTLDGRKYECIPTRIIDLKNPSVKEWYEKWVFLADLACKIRPRC